MQKWQWYTVFLQTEQGETMIEVEAYHEQDAVDRAARTYKREPDNKAEYLTGDAYVFVGRRQLLNLI